MKRETWDCIVVGSGAAGLSAALAAAPCRTLVLTKTADLESGSTPWAQGGIAAAAAPDDSAHLHGIDTLSAGGGFNDEAMVRVLTQEGPSAVRNLIRFGMPFDRDPEGSLVFSLEAAHSRPRVLKSDGDSTGLRLSATLRRAARESGHIVLQTETMAVRILRSSSAVLGVLAHSSNHGWISYHAPKVILATGGAGQLYLRTTNPAESTGDGPALALDAGVNLRDMEFVQFHPTALGTKSGAKGRIPLITEALRGAGALLVDRDGRSVMNGVHPQSDLAPRDAVARALWDRISRGDAVYLDARRFSDFSSRFPGVYGICRSVGIDPQVNPIPVAPAAHYLMGGVAVDAEGAAGLAGLYAVGECAGSRLHGANRLAGNSLLECLVFPRRAAGSKVCPLPAGGWPDGGIPRFPRLDSDALLRFRSRIRTIASAGLGIVRRRRDLEIARIDLDAVARELDRLPKDAGEQLSHQEIRNRQETLNILSVSRAICSAALNRRESLGAHFIESLNTEVCAC